MASSSTVLEQVRGALYDLAVAKANLMFVKTLYPHGENPDSFGLYFIECGDLVKIGKAKNAADRMRTLQTGCPTKLRLIAFFERKGSMEGELHARFGHLRVNGEWFLFTEEIRNAIKDMDHV